MVELFFPIENQGVLLKLLGSAVFLIELWIVLYPWVNEGTKIGGEITIFRLSHELASKKHY